jgi:hypothetical protein
MAERMGDHPNYKSADHMKSDSKSKHWIQGAINPAHKGYCTPLSNPKCTPRRRALAERFKKGGDLHG